jgi:hypothetical protein
MITTCIAPSDEIVEQGIYTQAYNSLFLSLTTGLSVFIILYNLRRKCPAIGT